MNPYSKILAQNIITIMQGSNYTDTVELKQPDGTPLNLTGYTVRSQLRSLDGTKVKDFACAIDDPESGIIARTLPAEDTAELQPDVRPNHVWGLELTAPDGAVVPEIQGGTIVDVEVCK